MSPLRGYAFMFPPLLAFGFESLSMLGWLAAAAAPWLIHLLSRRKYRETAWAAMDFLLAAMKRRTRRIRIEQWLLLLLRTLLIVALVAAVAQPYLEHPAPVFSPQGSTHRVLVIDSSYSMAYKAGGGTRFEQAKEWAARIVAQSPPGDGFTLLQMADPPRVIVATPGLEAGPVRQEIQNLELLDTGADLAATLNEVRKVLDTARRDSPRLTRHEVYFFSDLQRTTWMPALGDAAKTEFRRRAAELAAAAQLEVLNLGQPGDDNLAVTSLELRDPLVLVGRTAVLEAGVRDFGHVARHAQAVDLLVDGHPAGRQYLDIPAGGSAVARFNQRFETEGDHAVEVRLSGDPLKPGDVRGPADALEVDNHRYLAVQVRRAVRVLCVDGRPAGDPRRSSVFNLTLALAARSDPNSRSPIELDVAAENALSERDLERYDCVMLSDVAQFTASEARRLDNYLAHGGSLVFFLGDRVVAENYNNLLAGGTLAGSRQVLPARLIEVAKNPGGRLDALDYRHPIVQKFRGQEKAKLLESPVERYFKVRLLEGAAGEASAGDRPRSPIAKEHDTGPGEPQHAEAHAPGSPADAPGSPAANVVLALSNGDPLIVAQVVHRGRVVLVTTSADGSWSLLPIWGTYEPLVKEVLRWCIAGRVQPRNVVAGDPLESAVAATPALGSVSIERPGGQGRAVPLDVQGDYSTWRYDNTFTSGIYTARFPASLARNQLFAVNVATAESDLATISRDELENDVWPGTPLGYETAVQDDGLPLPAPGSPAAQLHVGLLAAVVVLLVLETLLAWRFGNNLR